jgi:hypothetical protein
MNENPLSSLFSRARDQYSSAVRWTFLAVILLLLVHLLTVGPFIELSREKSKTERENTRLSGVKSKIEGLGFTNVNASISERLSTFVVDLRHDFERINLTVKNLSEKDQPESRQPGEGDISNIAVQRERVQSVGKEVRPLEITDPNLLKKIKSSKNREELLIALKPYVEEKIIKPRYCELNEYWEDDILPEIHTQFEKLTNDMNDLKSDFPEGLEEWEKLSKAFKPFESTASKLKFKQRTEPPFWWSSVEGKERVRGELEEEVKSYLEEPAVLTSLHEQVTQSLTDEKKLGEKIDKDMEKLKEQFKEQEKKLGSIAKTLQFLALDLESVMVIFPLLLGLILAGATAWTTLRLRELGWTIHLMIKEGADQHLWDWYCAQVFLLLPKFSSNITKQHNSLLIRKSLGLCAMSWIWIGITAWRLHGISEITPVRLAVVTCIGATVAALAQVHHYVVINSTLSLKGEQAASVATSSQE